MFISTYKLFFFNFDPTCVTVCVSISRRTPKARSVLYVTDIVFAVCRTLFFTVITIYARGFTAGNKQILNKVCNNPLGILTPC